MEFRLKVIKMKCIPCDIIFLVEDDGQWDEPTVFDCPNCNKEAEYMDSITIAKEK